MASSQVWGVMAGLSGCRTRELQVVGSRRPMRDRGRAGVLAQFWTLTSCVTRSYLFTSLCMGFFVDNMCEGVASFVVVTIQKEAMQFFLQSLFCMYN